MWSDGIKVNKEFKRRMPQQKRGISSVLEAKWVTVNMVETQGSRRLADSKEIAKKNYIY